MRFMACLNNNEGIRDGDELKMNEEGGIILESK